MRAYVGEPNSKAGVLGRNCVASPGEAVPSPPSTFGDCDRLVGETPAIRELKSYLLKVASSDSNVLITGETGTGKEIAAELIHANSARRQGPCVRINCPAIPDTLIESELFGYERGAYTGADSLKDGMMRVANGGTVFFDEIGDLSLSAQSKILRAVETKEVRRLGSRSSTPVDVRVLAATNRDLDRLADDGRFRQDLYFRLNVARIHLPPLRERREDVPLLLRHYVREFNGLQHKEVEGFREEVEDRLLAHDWPGNVRELKNLIEACFLSVSSGGISLEDLPEHFRQRLDRPDRRSDDERERLLSTLASTRWNKSDAAVKLHWSRMTLYRKMAKYRISSGKGLL
jgi:transcriptional regulator with PAS, ATPase and Fis domain